MGVVGRHPGPDLDHRLRFLGLGHRSLGARCPEDGLRRVSALAERRSGMRRVRVALGLLILIASLALLVWGFLPSRHETRTQPISPTDLQLPTPVSLAVSSQF